MWSSCSNNHVAPRIRVQSVLESKWFCVKSDRLGKGNMKIERGMGRMKIKQSIVPQNPMAHVVRVGVARRGATPEISASKAI